MWHAKTFRSVAPIDRISFYAKKFWHGKHASLLINNRTQASSNHCTLRFIVRPDYFGVSLVYSSDHIALLCVQMLVLVLFVCFASCQYTQHVALCVDGMLVYSSRCLTASTAPWKDIPGRRHPSKCWYPGLTCAG